jgi:hypothetical protein
VLLRFLKPLFELSHLFGQMAYLIGISIAWFILGLLRGIEGLSQPVLLAAVHIEPTTLCGFVSHEWSVNSLAMLAILVGTALLGGSSIGISLTRALLGHVLSRFGGRCSLGHFGLGFLVCSLHASGRCDKMILE